MVSHLPMLPRRATETDMEEDRKKQAVLFDWGDTVMRVFPEYAGSMSQWPRAEAMPGIAATIDGLRRTMTICLATNAADSDERAIRVALSRCDLSERFDFVFSFRDLGHLKPAPEFFQAVLTRLELPPSAVFMVSDALRTDVEAAIAQGISGVWYNRGTTEVGVGPCCRTIRDFRELPAALKSLGAMLDTGEQALPRTSA